LAAALIMEVVTGGYGVPERGRAGCAQGTSPATVVIMAKRLLGQPVSHDHELERGRAASVGTHRDHDHGDLAAGAWRARPEALPWAGSRLASPAFHGDGGHRPGQTRQKMPRQREK
jgi:hypothetical protein